LIDPGKISPSAQKVQQVLETLGLSRSVVELPASTRTAPEAALAIGCQVGQIAKSLIFRGKRSGRAVLVIASGANRVSEKKLEMLIKEPLGKADAEFVHQETGYTIGGVPPVGHNKPLPTFIDEDLLQFDEIWAAAGTPHAVFRITPGELVDITRGEVCDLRQ
jgi:prolyl-tRNA editing enzyme YbaK/EbsC (Cys-tRNA(Pro) deacylase)